MYHRMLETILSAALLLAACEPQTREEPPSTDTGSPAAVAGQPDTRLDLFTDVPAPAAQLVFVGEQRASQMAAWPGAVFVPMSTFSVERDGIPNEFPPADSLAAKLAAAGVRGENVVIVGEPIPAGRAYAAFDYLGLGDRAVLLDGGLTALGSPTDSARARVTGADSAELKVDVREDLIVDAEWVHARLRDPNVAILDARPPAEFSGETPGRGITRPGHIPGARNLFWQTLVRSPDDARLKDEAELRRLFQEAGVDPGDTIVAYCRTGGQSSFLYAVARHLGYNVRLYDGSFIDWNRTDYPVAR
ncbi:MAG TPA: rhodanese-like domain-containing protein [Longimicrobiales bacterium]|nr:rhodanese-like domain-containing protein [Longimicrobiales bacterium]